MRTSSRTSESGEQKRRPFKATEKRLNPAGARLTTTAVSSAHMGRVRQSGTTPELHVRALVCSMGHRYRIRNSDLPGSPDLANRTQKWAIFVHGCYWHSHSGCPRATVPKRNRAFWLAKFKRNSERDRRAEEALWRLGFRVAVIWECEAGDRRQLEVSLKKILGE